MIVSVTCMTDRFNLSVVGQDFINDCCFGEDFSRWLVAALGLFGVEADLICMEDFGWANTATDSGIAYLMCVGGVSDDNPDHPNRGQWRVTLERHRTLKDRLLGKNKISISDPLVRKVAHILVAAGFDQVEIES